MIKILKRFAAFILQKEIAEQKADNVKLRKLYDELYTEKLNFPKVPKESLFFPLEKSDDSFENWNKIRQLIELEGWKILLRYLYGEIEAQEQEVGASNAHRFWYHQGQKSILASQWELADLTKKKLYHFAGVRERKEAHGEAPVEQPYQ
jgi:hypothetical protein